MAERAVSTKVEAAYASTDSSSVAKPAIVAVTSVSRDVTKYTVAEGDTVDSVATKFKISADTVKWANNLKDNTLAVGSELDILPRDGVLYTVKDGDTVEKIADKYKADASLITTYNDLELNGVTAGLRLIVPNGVLPENERPGYVAPRSYTAPTTSGSVSGSYVSGYGAGFGGRTWHIKTGTPMYAGNKYAFGNCTAYAFDRRAEMGRPVGGMWGNAATWAFFASRAGYKVNNVPAVGAVMQNGGGYGHVAIVERILPNGDVEISEMNASVAGGGFNQVSGRIVSAAIAGQYVYIH
ncbi:LysM peptidoglycan-binding domain-containing protein [Candidatus Saccharibacteria bacterium TM7i]|nr:LysM peptidoglycan-binding domain-containing protein [Candidatus Saccharibacteria bacterium TM7i]